MAYILASLGKGQGTFLLQLQLQDHEAPSHCLTWSDKSKLFPSGKATHICVSQKDIAQSLVIPPSFLADVLNSAVKPETKQKIDWD
jgi:hypothetical protein